MAGAVTEITVITIVSVFILIVRIIILTFIIRISYVSFINLKILIIAGDINLVDFIHPFCIDGLLGEDAGLEIHCFLKSCL